MSNIPLLHRLPAFATGKLVHVVIDTPMGERNKFKFDEEWECFKLAHVLPVGAVFPGDFGFIPRTRAPDGDALDVLLLSEAPTFVGCVVTAQLIGGLRASQTIRGKAQRNDRLLAVPVTPIGAPSISRLTQVPNARLAELEHFFVSYNEVRGRLFNVDGRMGPAEARRVVRDAMRRYREQADPPA